MKGQLGTVGLSEVSRTQHVTVSVREDEFVRRCLKAFVNQSSVRIENAFGTRSG